MENRIFFPQAALDEWIVDGTVELTSNVLTILSEGRRYELAEAVLVVREVSGAGDPHDLLGRVKILPILQGLGAELIETSMLLGDAAYDVEPGWVGTPVETFAEYMASDARKLARGDRGGPEPRSDEEVLASSLAAANRSGL
jgi:hypothetical protein